MALFRRLFGRKVKNDEFLEMALIPDGIISEKRVPTKEEKKQEKIKRREEYRLRKEEMRKLKKEKRWRSKLKKKDRFLLEEYEKGKILQVDNQADNKQHFGGL